LTLHPGRLPEPQPRLVEERCVMWKPPGRDSLLGARQAALVTAALLLTACSSGLSGTGRAPAPLPAAADPGSSRASAAGAATGAVPLSARAGFTAFSASNMPLWVALEAGYFREQGLEVEMTQIAGGPTLLAAMRAGELDFASAGGPHIVLGNLQGLETVIVGASSNRMEGSILGRVGLQRVEELRGKTIAVTRLNSISDQAARVGLQRVGLQPDADVAFLASGGYPESLAALDAGVVDGASLDGPFLFEMRKRGYPEVLNVSEMKIPFALGVIGTSKRVIGERPGLPERALRGLARAIRRLQTDRELGISILGRYSQMEDRELLAPTIDRSVPLYQADLYPDREAVQAVLDAEDQPAARTARPEDVIDYRYVDELRGSGFLDQIAQ
jgi:NitT/TauT family transport system substrate-binding protein